MKFDINNPYTWKASCVECGHKMDYSPNRFTYYCSYCGNILEV